MATIDYKQKIKDYMNSSEVDTLYKSMLNNLFPELKESEDERMRRQTLKVLNYYKDEEKSEGRMPTEIDECIVWLEKQGEQKDILEDAILDSNKDGLIADTIRYKREKQGKQKPADKVEPNFHEGEWIIHHGTENIYQVTAIVDNQYQLKYGDNYTVQKCADVDRCARLWDIAKDAKDGDLIYISTEEKGIQAIFHEYKNGTIFFHCYLCRDFVQGGYMPIGSVELVYPLQKVHYKRFFEKMHEAGYEWDAEHKQLKKIEQKPADTEKVAKGNEREIPNSAWSEEDEKEVAVLEAYIRSRDWSERHVDRALGIVDELVNKVKSIKSQSTWKPSDEQMGVIEAVINNRSFQRRHLDSLYADLKKLRGE